jgi:hypothetical protein
MHVFFLRTQGVILMAENNIDDIRQRTLRRPPMSQRRLENVSLDLEVPLEHETSETLPLVAHETLGVGYGFDRLYALDLSLEQPVPIPLPSRHELMKLARDKAPSELMYMNINGHFGGPDWTNGANARSASNDDNRLYDFMQTETIGINTKGQGHFVMETQTTTDFEDFAKAFIGSGASGTPTDVNKAHCVIAPRVRITNDAVHGDQDDAKNQLMLDPAQLQKIIQEDGSINADNRSSIRTLQYLYNWMSPSAWETLLANRKLFTELPKNLPYLDKAFYSLYQRDKIGAFKTKIRDLHMLYLVLGMTECMYAIRRGRFSKNISSSSSNTDLVNKFVSMLGISDVAGTNVASRISGGVINPFFQVLENANTKLLVAPWWLINKLNHTLYADTDRDEEVRDVERKDITEMMTLLLEAMEVERGMHWGSESSLPMLLFDKFKEGQLPDFSDFTDTNAALSATLLGYRSARDAYYDQPDNSIGRVPYYGTIATSRGQLIGKDRLEFLDRVKEMEDHTCLSPNPEKFKQGMQYTNPFDYTTMVTRTRFGDHSMDIKVHPFGFYRGVKLQSNIGGSPVFHFGGHKSPDGALNLVYFPVYNWGQFYEHVSPRGLLPFGHNGAYYATGGSKNRVEAHAESTAAQGTALDLWPNNYWRPGADNYSARLLKSTDELFESWIDRGEQVRVDGATFPTVGPINLMAEMTYTTPMAMLQRNWPWLRKMGTYASHSPFPNSDDTSFDYMTFGDNMFNMGVHALGSVDDTVTQVARSGPFALRDRDLFSTTTHLRSGGTELLPVTLPLSKAPDNWVAVLQARDAMYFLTSMLSEPIMDAYTWNFSAGGKSNGVGSARLVIYQGSKTFEGRVEDVFCTPIVGTGLRFDESAGNNVQDVEYPVNSGTGVVTRTSIFPSANAAQKNHNYLMFLLGSAKVASGECLVARSQASIGGINVLDRVVLPGLKDDGTVKHGLFIAANTPMDEEDFVPGLSWDKLWLAQYPTNGSGVALPWGQVFAHPYSQEATAATIGLAYLQAVGGVGLGGTFAANPGYELGLADHLIDDWRMIHVNWIENVRVNLEYQRASPSFYVFDADITDRDESYLRQSLFPLGLSTVGPLTFVGALGPEGQQVAAETVTGPTVFELNSLTLGAGSLDESPSQADDQDVGDENPSLHIAEKQDV